MRSLRGALIHVTAVFIKREMWTQTHTERGVGEETLGERHVRLELPGSKTRNVGGTRN